MNASALLMDLRLWIAGAIVVSFAVSGLDLPFSTLIIVVLMIQMTLSMDGLNLSLRDLVDNRKGAAFSVFVCYVVNTVVTLAAGALFIGKNDDIWYGWVMLASMPCAISVVTAAILMNERIETSVLAVTATYVFGVVLTPVLSFALIGDAVNPLKILQYILLFIIIPVVISRFLPRFHLKKSHKVPVINLMMAIMVFCSVNSNKEAMEADPTLMMLIFAVAVGRVILLHLIMWLMLRKARFAEGSRGVYLVLGVWKNTGLSVSMSMILLSGSAVVPCFMSMIVETVWFSLVTRSHKDKGETKIINQSDADTTAS